MMRIKTAADRKVKREAKRKAKREVIVRHLNRMHRLDRAKGKLAQPPDPKVDIIQPRPKAELKQKAEPKTASISKEDRRNMFHHWEDGEWENQLPILPFFDVIGAFFKLFFKSIELSLAVIGVYVGETRREYKKLLHEAEGKTNAELEDDIDKALSNYTLKNWLMFFIHHTFQAFWNMRDFAGDMFLLATIALKRDRRTLIFVLGICLLIGFGVMYLYDVFFQIVSVYTLIRELFGLH